MYIFLKTWSARFLLLVVSLLMLSLVEFLPGIGGIAYAATTSSSITASHQSVHGGGCNTQSPYDVSCT